MKRRKSILFFLCFLLLVACKKPVEGKTGTDEASGLNGFVSDNHITLSGGMMLEGLVVQGTDDKYYCNLEENMRSTGSGNYHVLVSRDSVYGITYYVNYGRDYYIYALKDGKADLVVKIPGRDLFCRNGELYFIADSYGLYELDSFESGNILKYNPLKGSVEVVLDCEAANMIVYQDGISYKCVGETISYGDEKVISTDMEYFFYSFCDKESVSLPEGVAELRRWKDLFVQTRLEKLPESDPTVKVMRASGYTDDLFAPCGVDLVDVQGNKEQTLLGVNSLPMGHWICGDLSYYVAQLASEDDGQTRYVLMAYYINTGEREEIIELFYPTVLTRDDMIFVNGTVYFGNKLRVSLTDRRQSYLQYADEEFGKIESFYTDGESVYCLYNGKIWRYEETKEKSVSTQEFIEGKPLGIGEYAYMLFDPGDL